MKEIRFFLFYQSRGKDTEFLPVVYLLYLLWDAGELGFCIIWVPADATAVIVFIFLGVCMSSGRILCSSQMASFGINFTNIPVSGEWCHICIVHKRSLRFFFLWTDGASVYKICWGKIFAKQISHSQEDATDLYASEIFHGWWGVDVFVKLAYILVSKARKSAKPGSNKVKEGTATSRIHSLLLERYVSDSAWFYVLFIH